MKKFRIQIGPAILLIFICIGVIFGIALHNIWMFIIWLILAIAIGLNKKDKE